MRRSSKPRQQWEVGQSVKVGFLTLTIYKFTPSNGDGLPGSWHLTDAKLRDYVFTPYNGLERVTPYNGLERIA